MILSLFTYNRKHLTPLHYGLLLATGIAAMSAADAPLVRLRTHIHEAGWHCGSGSSGGGGGWVGVLLININSIYPLDPV